MGNDITLMELAERLQKPSYLCLVKEENNNPNKLILTRWKEEGDCDFSQVITLDKGLIDTIYPTEYFCLVAEKKLEVVDVVFKTDATIPLSDLLTAVWGPDGPDTFKSLDDILRFIQRLN